ncbi:helix-turn-helix domain-containing protein [Jannaschia sp. M317]|uniref:helix-turn-helix domain-containing protein n=1 Tax=Jannaschia sp. M317 TaxID=2867011 RepID=UPI0021A7CCA5|nr:cupin domain-containing protein [Jannaschia sp. M317]UWQ17748.1 cupin domain-containing protein [Jannaschia sp. M317]
MTMIQTMNGADLRALRKSRSLTLTALAEAMGRSVGWLSQVERDLSTLTPEDGRRMAATLGVAPSLLAVATEEAPGEAGRIVRADNRRVIGPRQDGLYETLVSPDLTDPFEIVHAVFDPGTESAPDIRRATQEIGYLLSGQLDLSINGAAYTVGPGDSFRIRDEPYSWSNPYETPAVAIWVISPPVY